MPLLLPGMVSQSFKPRGEAGKKSTSVKQV
jgi:hypothetical protein